MHDALSGARFDPFRELAQRPLAGAVGDLMARGDDERERPLDDLERRHEGEAGVPCHALWMLSHGRTMTAIRPTCSRGAVGAPWSK